MFNHISGNTVGTKYGELESNLDTMFIQRVINEVTNSCILPMKLPTERVQEYILQAAQWFWENDDSSVEERSYCVPNSTICQTSKLNKTVKLPQQIVGVHGLFKTSGGTLGNLGDFSLERMMMSNYSFNYGNMQGGYMSGTPGYNLTDVTSSMYELSTYRSMLEVPITYNYNRHSSILVLLGDLGRSDLVINCFVRCRIQDLYNSYYFFRFVVCLVYKSLTSIYGTFEFKLPGGVTLNADSFKDKADEEISEIKEWVKENRAVDVFFMSNTN